jgi:hypothetical protein
MVPARGKQIKQMFWAAFSGLPRRLGLIPLFGDPLSRRGGVSSRTMKSFIGVSYLRYLIALILMLFFSKITRLLTRHISYGML